MQYDDVITNPRWRTDAILKMFFLAISRCHIGRFMRNLDRKWRITCQYRIRNQNSNFRNFKMADGRHFENSFISIFQPRIIHFRSNLVRFHSEDGHLTKNWNFTNSRWRYWKFYLLYFGAILADLCEIWTADVESHASTGHMTKLETKASSHQGQCIPAGCQVTLPRRVFIVGSFFWDPWPFFSYLFSRLIWQPESFWRKISSHLLLENDG